MQLQVSDEADGAAAGSAPRSDLSAILVRQRSGSSLGVGAGVMQGLHWLTH